MITYQGCKNLLYEIRSSGIPDDRKPPDDGRKRQFTAGWKRSTKDHAKPMQPKTLERLKWNNLGYRAGKRFGGRSDSVEKIHACRDLFVKLYHDEAENNATDIRLPEELDASQALYEGAKREIMVNAYERNPEARQRCIHHYGPFCAVCGFDFAATYGEAGAGYIQVHHLTQLSDIGQTYEVNPIADLCPVCANCHAIIHRRKPMYSIKEVQEMLKPSHLSGANQ